MDLLIAVVVLVLLAGFVYVARVNLNTGETTKKSTQAVSRSKKAYPVRRSPYRATSIVNENSACSEVKKFLNVKFLDLDNRVPSLPLANCNLGHCNCEYVYHEDRREGEGDRRAPGTLSTELYERSGNRSRRNSGRGRRKTDFSQLNIGYSGDFRQASR